jgi:DNA-binding transcriptional LysR family regulator
MDPLYLLRLFAETSRLGNLSAAARQLGVSTATASRGIDRLEHDLGFALLVRTSRQIALTEMGRTYLETVQRALRDLDEAKTFGKSLHSGVIGDLSIRSRAAIGMVCISPLIPKFLDLHPGINLRIDLTNETNGDLTNGKYDVDIRTGILKDSSLLARKLADSKRLVIASPTYLSKHGIPRKPADLNNHNCLVFRNDANSVVWRFRARGGEEVKVQPKGNLEANSGAILQESLLSGIGIGHSTDWAVAEDLKRGDLVRVLSDHQVTVDDFDHGIYAVFLPNRQHSVKVRAFIDFLASEFARSPVFDHGASA